MNKTSAALTLALCLTVLSAPACAASPSGQTGVPAVGCAAFLDSLGVNTHIDQGYNPEHYLDPLRYLGIRNIRDGGRNLQGDLMLHREAGVRVDLVVEDLLTLETSAKTLANAQALLAIEGPNEPNNFPIAYKGQKGGGEGSWKPVAAFQAALYKAVKSDPLLEHYPVFAVSEGGAETDNAGMQFLTVPKGAGTEFPEGTKFADYANAHNYVSGHGNLYSDNQAWQAADPVLNGRWDGLYVEYGKTWKKHFKAYSKAELQRLPRVTTETGWDSLDNSGGERAQGTVLVNTCLAQFKRGWRYTFIYELGDGEGGTGHQGLYRKDGTPKPVATSIHNLTTILADDKPLAHPGSLAYAIPNEPETVHDLLLQKSDGVFYLVVWGEKVSGFENVSVDLGKPHAEIRIYDVTKGTAPLSTLHNAAQIPLKLSDHAMVAEIR
ncbi:MAG: glycosyl hydrolase [Alphaproteobacteria bacterium]|nr:glycosyl hydrolase [Alphaproteobacteria bacterium]